MARSLESPAAYAAATRYQATAGKPVTRETRPRLPPALQLASTGPLIRAGDLRDVTPARFFLLLRLRVGLRYSTAPLEAWPAAKLLRLSLSWLGGSRLVDCPAVLG